MDELLKKLSELATTIGLLQTKNNELEKRCEGLSLIEFKKIQDAAVKISTEIEDLKSKRVAEQKRLEEAEKALAFLNTTEVKNANLEERYKEAFAAYCRNGVHIPDMLVKEVNEAFIKYACKGLTADQREKQMKDLSTQIGAEGGFWIIPQRLSQLITRDFETSPMRQICNVITTANKSVELIIDDNEGVTGGWVGEKQARPKTNTPEIGLLEIFAHEQYAMPAATQGMLDDAGFDVEGWLQRKISDKFTRYENNAFLAGNGVAKPKGILSYAAWAGTTYERDKLQHVVSGSNGAFTADSLIGVQNALHEVYQPGASWIMQRLTWGKVLVLKNLLGQYLINPQLIKDGTDLVLLGKPVKFAADMQASGVKDNLSVAYGNFNLGYTIVDRLGVRVIRDVYTSKPYILYYTTKRVGGAVTNYDSIKIMKESA